MNQNDTEASGTEHDEELYRELSVRVDEREGETRDPRACLAAVEELAENLRKAGWANGYSVDTDADQRGR